MYGNRYVLGDLKIRLYKMVFELNLTYGTKSPCGRQGDDKSAI